MAELRQGVKLLRASLSGVALFRFWPMTRLPANGYGEGGNIAGKIAGPAEGF